MVFKDYRISEKEFLIFKEMIKEKYSKAIVKSIYLSRENKKNIILIYDIKDTAVILNSANSIRMIGRLEDIERTRSDLEEKTGIKLINA